jgi:inosine-uridine nucleoside N-ribohydrolase
MTCTPTDISIQTKLTPAMVKRIEAGGTALGHYIARYFQPGQGNDYMWDELAAAAWIDPSVITEKETRYLDVDIDHGAGYGNTLTWTSKDDVKVTVRPVEIHVSLDKEKFYEMFARLMSGATPKAR